MRAKYPLSADMKPDVWGYSLYRQLKEHSADCRILAPATMAVTNTNRVKTDRKDAANIARCLAFRTYSEAYVPDEADSQVKEYIRMRGGQKLALEKPKQPILAFVLGKGKRSDGGKAYWTIAHLKWLRGLEPAELDKETPSEHLTTYDYLAGKTGRLDKRIEELASGERYREKVKNMGCLLGAKTHTVLPMAVEIGDFGRFAKARQFAGFPGLVPSEDPGAEDISRYGTTKAGNRHLRRLMAEAAQSHAGGAAGHKSAALKKWQEGCPPEVVAYADKANERLRRRFYKLTLNKGISRNKATTATARELSCFIWGMMTGNVA